MPEHPKKKGLSTGTKLRLFAAVVVLFVAAGFATLFYLNREPSYKGTTLTEWVNDLVVINDHPRDTPAAIAIRQIGTNAIPYLIKWLNPHQQPSRFRKLMERLSDASGGSIDLPETPNRTVEATEAFKILGPIAKPAIPVLEQLLHDTNFDVAVAYSLANIGSDSLPVLTNALGSTNESVRRNALLGLGRLGYEAQTAAPLVESLIHDTNSITSRTAILNLGQLGKGVTPYIPELNEMLQTNHHAIEAAMALFHLGYTSELLRYLTNDSTKLRETCKRVIVAFSPFRFDLKNVQHSTLATSGTVKGDSLNTRTDPRQHVDEETIQLLNAYLKSTNASERAQAADDLAFFGGCIFSSVAPLSKALSDTNEMVRHSAAEALKKIDLQIQDGGIIRGPRKEKKIALEFTGHEFAEGGETILDELSGHRAKASFFLTGDFLRNPEFTPLVHRIIRNGHYLGTHSDKHLLYCAWDTKKTIVTQNTFNADVPRNLAQFGFNYPSPFWIPPYEHYNEEIAEWSSERGLILVNFTPGTRSNADYTQESDTNFVSSQAIFDSIMKKEREDPDGLNGFLLLMHLGAGPGRKDKMHPRFGELLDALSAKGYQFVRIDELLGESGREKQ
ncbi:MAG TPA: HEAT repeat domain-containing protein [Verrucomicrobiae bacterium]|nr:HEAT repeat domain-containing protein [Verrucomicrobiae bacterium]